MSTGLLVTLTVVEIVVLVAALAVFVILITRRLRSIGNALRQVSGGTIRAIQGDVFLVGAGAAILNRKLKAIANALPPMAEKAESLASQPTTQIPAQTRGEPSGAGWQAAVTQDPVVRRS